MKTTFRPILLCALNLGTIREEEKRIREIKYLRKVERVATYEKVKKIALNRKCKLSSSSQNRRCNNNYSSKNCEKVNIIVAD